MHVHANQMSLSTINPFTAAAEKAFAAQRAANTRKKLAKSADTAEVAATPEETLMISGWMHASQGQGRNP